MRWVIGDIHGMLGPLEALLDAVERRDPDARFFFTGDYVNRGPDARGVLDRLVSLPRSKATFVRGNHDDVFDMIVNGRDFCDHPSCGDATAGFVWFMNHGLDTTLESYGVDYAQLEHTLRHPTPERIGQIAAAVPESHRRFIRELPAIAHEREFFVAHAQWDPDDVDDPPHIENVLKDSHRARFRLIWGRYAGREINSRKRWMRTGYFGHTPVQSYNPGRPNVPIVGPKIVLLDTGAALSPAGRLSAVCAETDELVQVDRVGVPLEPEAA